MTLSGECFLRPNKLNIIFLSMGYVEEQRLWPSAFKDKSERGHESLLNEPIVGPGQPVKNVDGN